MTYYAGDWTQASSSANNNTVLYTGRTLEITTGLYYYRARYYDPSLGRFISRDPMGTAGSGVNLYVYCGDNPTDATDPTGQVVYVVESTYSGANRIGELKRVEDQLALGRKDVAEALAELKAVPDRVFALMVKSGNVKYGNEQVGYRVFMDTKAAFAAVITREYYTDWDLIDRGGYEMAMYGVREYAAESKYWYDEVVLLAHGGVDEKDEPTGNALFNTNVIPFAQVNAAIAKLQKQFPTGRVIEDSCFNNPTAEATVSGLSPFYGIFSLMPLTPRNEKVLGTEWLAKHCRITLMMPYLKILTALPPLK